MLVIDWSEDRHWERWLVRVRLGDAQWRIVNPIDPTFWRHIWTMWKGRRLWAACWWIRHAVRREG
jgi:hypothetical protein